LTQGVSVVSDGWTDIKNKPLINVIVSNSRGSCFLYVEDFSGVEKTGEAIAQYLLKAIDEIGPGNVLQVVTDNAANFKAVGKEIEKVSHIFCPSNVFLSWIFPNRILFDYRCISIFLGPMRCSHAKPYIQEFCCEISMDA
jgi:hypothetical protein